MNLSILSIGWKNGDVLDLLDLELNCLLISSILLNPCRIVLFTLRFILLCICCRGIFWEVCLGLLELELKILLMIFGVIFSWEKNTPVPKYLNISWTNAGSLSYTGILLTWDVLAKTWSKTTWRWPSSTTQLSGRIKNSGPKHTTAMDTSTSKVKRWAKVKAISYPLTRLSRTTVLTQQG